MSTTPEWPFFRMKQNTEKIFAIHRGSTRCYCAFILKIWLKQAVLYNKIGINYNSMFTWTYKLHVPMDIEEDEYRVMIKLIQYHKHKPAMNKGQFWLKKTNERCHPRHTGISLRTNDLISQIIAVTIVFEKMTFSLWNVMWSRNFINFDKKYSLMLNQP